MIGTPHEGAFLENGPVSAARTMVLAHGAGQPMDSPFMNRIAEGLASSKLRVLRFEFPYMQKQRAAGRRRPQCVPWPSRGKLSSPDWAEAKIWS